MADRKCSEKNFRYDDSAAIQAQAVAQDIATQLRAAVQERGRALVAFSGGSTPAAMLRALRQETLDWSRVTITLVDERCVPESSERSNAGMLRRCLTDGLAPAPAVVPLYRAGESAAERDQRLGRVERPFDVVHLGMGEDGHTASFFPDAPNIAEMLDMRQTRDWLVTRSASSGEERITWSLAALVAARYFVLQLIGERKLAVLSEALDALRAGRSDVALRLPVAAYLAETELLRPDGIPGRVYFAEN